MVRRVAVSGTGGQAINYLSYFHRKGYEIKGIKSSDIARAEHLGESYGATGYSQLDKLLSKEEIDLLVVASIPITHFDDVRTAARHNIRHMIIEKPIAPSVTLAKQIEDIIIKNDINVSVCYGRRYQPSYLYLARAMRESLYGGVRNIYSNISFPRDVDPEVYPYKWWVNREASGGGAIFQVGVHWFNYIFSLVGYGFDLVKSSVVRNEQGIDDTMSAVWVKRDSSAPVCVTMLMTSAIPLENAFIFFQFEKADVIYVNGGISVLSPNSKAICLRNPIRFCERLIGLSKHLVRRKWRELPLLDHYLDVTLSEVICDESKKKEFLRESVNDVRLLQSILSLEPSLPTKQNRKKAIRNTAGGLDIEP